MLPAPIRHISSPGCRQSGSSRPATVAGQTRGCGARWPPSRMSPGMLGRCSASRDAWGEDSLN